MVFSVVAPNLTRRQIRVIVGQMFQRSKDFFPMKIAVTLLVILVVVGSAKFGGAQQPSPIPNASPIAISTPTPANADSNPTPAATASPTPTATPTPAATPLPPSGLRILH